MGKNRTILPRQKRRMALAHHTLSKKLGRPPDLSALFKDDIDMGKTKSQPGDGTQPPKNYELKPEVPSASPDNSQKAKPRLFSDEEIQTGYSRRDTCLSFDVSTLVQVQLPGDSPDNLIRIESGSGSKITLCQSCNLSFQINEGKLMCSHNNGELAELEEGVHHFGEHAVEIKKGPQWGQKYFVAGFFEKLDSLFLPEKNEVSVGPSQDDDVCMPDANGKLALISRESGIPFITPFPGAFVLLNGTKLASGSWVQLENGDMISSGRSSAKIIENSNRKLGNLCDDVSIRLFSSGTKLLQIPISPDENHGIVVGRFHSYQDAPSIQTDNGTIHLNLPEMDVSRKHASIGFSEKGILAVRDDDSYNGTSLNGAKIPTGQSFPLLGIDSVDIGSFRLVVYPEDAFCAPVPGVSEALVAKTKSLAGLTPEARRHIRSSLRLMEAAIRSSRKRGSLIGSDEALSIWKKRMEEELDFIYSLPAQEHGNAVENLVSSSEKVISLLCQSNQYELGRLLYLLESTQGLFDFAKLSDLLQSLEKSKIRKIKSNKKLLANVTSRCADNAKISDVVAVASNTARNNKRGFLHGRDENLEKVKEGLFDLENNMHELTDSDICRRLNLLLNKSGLAVELDEETESVILFEISAMLEAGEKKVMVATPLNAPNLFETGEFSYILGRTSQNILINGNSDVFVAEAIQQAADVFSGLQDRIRSDRGESAEPIIISTALAAGYAYSEMSEDQILGKLRKKSNDNSNDGKAAGILFNYLISENGSGPRELLKRYIDDTYDTYLGIRQSRLIGAQSDPASIVSGNLNYLHANSLSMVDF